MKIRSGFVSNSSSSSFVIYGTVLEGNLIDFFDGINLEKIKSNIEDEDSDDNYYVEEALKKSFPELKEFDFYFDYDNNSTYVGRSWSSVGDDETGAQFKEKVRSTLKKYFDCSNDEIYTIHEEVSN